jgi:hypothetical protein
MQLHLSDNKAFGDTDTITIKHLMSNIYSIYFSAGPKSICMPLQYVSKTSLAKLISKSLFINELIDWNMVCYGTA